MRNPANDDVTEIKALSNPLRMRIYLVLRVEGRMSIGRLCEQVGAPAGSVSYHVRVLAKAGLIESANEPGQDGRESYWKAREGGEDPNGAADAANANAENFRRTRNAVYDEMYRQYLNSVEVLPTEWREAEFASDSVLDLTPSELGEFVSDYEQLLKKWDSRSQEAPTDSSKKVAVLFHAFRWIP